MSSKRLETVPLEISWSNIQDQIAALLYAMRKIPEGTEILSIKLNYPGGFVSQDKIIPVEVVIRKGVQVLRF